MNRVMAMILAGGEGNRLSILAEERAKPAVIFGGSYRIIDFSLSNCVNSGIFNVAVLTQYRPRSLNDHIGIGRPWGLDFAVSRPHSSGRGAGVRLLQPYLGRQSSDWYRGTADAVYQNLYVLQEQHVGQVLILAGDHVYKMRYEEMVDFHQARGADVTVAVTQVPLSEASRYGVLTLGGENEITAFEEKPPLPKSNLISMGIYVFNKHALIERLEEDSRKPHSRHDFGRDIVPSMELLEDAPALDLYDPENVVHTRHSEKPAAKFGPKVSVARSLISEGCVVHGEVRRSVLSPGVRVEEGVVVEDSIIFDDAYIGKGAYIHRSIIDKQVHVGENTFIGWGEDLTPNRQEPNHLNTGITVVGKRARIPKGTMIGRNCKICPAVREADFRGSFVASGETVEPAG